MQINGFKSKCLRFLCLYFFFSLGFIYYVKSQDTTNTKYMPKTVQMDSIYILTSGDSSYIKINNKVFDNIESQHINRNKTNGSLRQKGEKNIIKVEVGENNKGSNVSVQQTGQGNKVTIRQNSRDKQP
jgi:hypothetical protein